MERFRPGERIGNYRVEREIVITSSRGFYEVMHALLPRRALLKLRSQPFAVELLREACILEALRHPGIPDVYESGVLPDRRAWFTLEIMHGTTVAELGRRGQVAASEVATIIRDVAEVLEHAHRRGVVHRGLRPDRIMVTDRTIAACVIDWSDARAHDAPVNGYEPSVADTPYLAPELLRGDVIDDRADVFALGVIAYQALTGSLPFGTTSLASIGKPHVSVAERCPRLPDDLAQMVDQMLALDRFDRPNASEVRAGLGGLARGSGIPIAMSDQITEPLAVPRLRKPRWTPQISYVTSEQASEVSGEIVAKDS